MLSFIRNFRPNSVLKLPQLAISFLLHINVQKQPLITCNSSKCPSPGKFTIYLSDT